MVSVIIPVYNVKKYLMCCIESVVHQTYSDMEILLIDDGSTDDSGKICDEYAKRDERIHVIHQENRGLSAARNIAIDQAHGDYIFFLDGDDYLNYSCIKTAVSLCEKTDADIAVLQMINTKETSNEQVELDEGKIKKVYSPEEAIEASLYQVEFSCCAPSKLYKKHIFDNVRFPVGKLAEDLATCHLLIDNAEKIAYSNYIGYYYRQRSGSIMRVFNPNRLDAIQWAKDIQLYCMKNHPKIQKAADCRLFNVAVHLLLDLPDAGELHDKCFPEIWKSIVSTRWSVILNHKSRFREKAAAMLSLFGEKTLKKVWHSKLAIRREEL